MFNNEIIGKYSKLVEDDLKDIAAEAEARNTRVWIQGEHTMKSGIVLPCLIIVDCDFGSDLLTDIVYSVNMWMLTITPEEDECRTYGSVFTKDGYDIDGKEDMHLLWVG